MDESPMVEWTRAITDVFEGVDLQMGLQEFGITSWYEQMDQRVPPGQMRWGRTYTLRLRYPQWKVPHALEALVLVQDLWLEAEGGLVSADVEVWWGPGPDGQDRVEKIRLDRSGFLIERDERNRLTRFGYFVVPKAMPQARDAETWPPIPAVRVDGAQSASWAICVSHDWAEADPPNMIP